MEISNDAVLKLLQNCNFNDLVYVSEVLERAQLKIDWDREEQGWCLYIDTASETDISLIWNDDAMEPIALMCREYFPFIENISVNKSGKYFHWDLDLYFLIRNAKIMD